MSLRLDVGGTALRGPLSKLAAVVSTSNAEVIDPVAGGMRTSSVQRIHPNFDRQQSIIESDFRKRPPNEFRDI
jgi:hypothetical protein